MAAPAADTVVLVPHRAVYDLKLAKSHGSRGIQAVRGRILYDFSGNACDGYQLQFRQVSELDSGEGKAAVSDLRSTTWEDGTAKKFRFNSENILNDQRTDTVNGHAERNAQTVAVGLSKPTEKSFSLPVGSGVSTEHMRRIIVAAREGKTILEFPVYDGSGNRREAVQHADCDRPPDWRRRKAAGRCRCESAGARQTETLAGNDQLFDKQDDDKTQGGEQTPVYSISFELYENGISRALTLDYSDFTISGEMTSLDVKKEKACP